MRIDPQSHVPIYRQIVDAIRRAVARGVYRAGDPLPSVRELALESGVNPNTVQRAYEELEREGLIAARRGLGMFVQRGGLQSARTQSHAEVAAAFDEAVRMAAAADMSPDAVQRLFTRAMDRAFAKEPER